MTCDAFLALLQGEITVVRLFKYWSDKECNYWKSSGQWCSKGYGMWKIDILRFYLEDSAVSCKEFSNVWVWFMRDHRMISWRAVHVIVCLYKVHVSSLFVEDFSSTVLSIVAICIVIFCVIRLDRVLKWNGGLEFFNVIVILSQISFHYFSLYRIYLLSNCV